MKQKLINHFSRISPLSPDEATAIAESTITRNYPKGTLLISEGQPSNDSYFVLKGLVRQYNLLDGEEKTTGFFTEEQWVIALTNTEEIRPSAHYWVCDEDTTLVLGNDNLAQDLFRKHPRLEMIARKVLENVFAEYQQTMNAYLTHTPEQRYLWLLESKPGLIQRIPQYQLASYIGVKPESLSRIRKRIATKS